MRVLLDTNVLASAVATRGLCADVMREVIAKHELVLCDQICSELRRILRAKFGLTREVIEDIIDLFGQDAVLAHSASPPNLRLKDKDDLGILAAAKNGEAQMIVTGDKELQNLGQYSGIKIVSPRVFWQELTS